MGKKIKLKREKQLLEGYFISEWLLLFRNASFSGWCMYGGGNYLKDNKIKG